MPTRWIWPRAAHGLHLRPVRLTFTRSRLQKLIEIQAGEIKPVRIVVVMLNSAGVFQLDALLKEKLHGSGLEEYVVVIATIHGETEKKLVEVFRV